MDNQLIYNYRLNSKQLKINKINTILSTNNYIFIFRYNDLKLSEMIILNHYLKKNNLKLLNIKHNLFQKFFNFKINSGPILILYSNELNNLSYLIPKFNEIQLQLLFLFMTNKNIKYSFFKFKRLLGFLNSPFFNCILQLQKNILLLLFTLKNIK